MLLMVVLIDHLKMKEDHDEIDLIVKDFEQILMVQVYDDDYDEMMYDDLIDLFVGMNVEMNWKNDGNDYYDEDDYVNVIENDFVNENDLIT